MPKITIDDQELEVESGLTVFQACEVAGIEIPHFCYHPKLSIAGNCRMCLVEVEKSPKPVASCAMPVNEGMVIRTQTEMVKKARKGVLELLLINHPLDCPICDQGGECDLQDLTLNYGPGEGRFDLNKRAVENKHMGPLIKTVMNRCIHCTRCVRFATEIAGVQEIGVLNRGEHSEITSYLEQAVTSELSGNMIDICPVGALTNKPYAFHGRPWELTQTDSIDVMDAVGSNIRIDTRNREVMRVLPRLNEDINEDWISDRTRFSYDGLSRQRLDTPYVRKNGKLEACSWDEAFVTIAEKLKTLHPSEIAALTGDLVDVESVYALKLLMDGLGSPHRDCRQDGSRVPTSVRSHYLFNTGITNLERADFILLVGTNPRHEATLINARIRKTYLQGRLKIAAIGEEVDLTYPVEWLGNNPKLIKEIADGKHAVFEKLKTANNPVIIVGQGALARRDGEAIFELLTNLAQKAGVIKEDWNGFNVLHTAAGRVGALDVGFTPRDGGFDRDHILDGCQSNRIKALYLHGVDEIDPERYGQAFVIYQGSHGDITAHRADVILPGCTYTEKTALYVNTEGRVQEARQAVTAPGLAKEDWKIVKALSLALGINLPFQTREELLTTLCELNPLFKTRFIKVPNSWAPFHAKHPETLSAHKFDLPITNYYMTDPISRHSTIMAECARKVGGKHHVVK